MFNSANGSEKQILRAQMRARRGAIAPQERAVAAKQVFERLRALYHAQKWPCVAVYLASEPEISLDEFAQWLLERRVPVFAPRGDSFSRLRSLDDLIVGKFGVREPAQEARDESELLAKGVFLVPGLAFDRNGGRLGFGGGWYDRALARFPQACKIGVAFDCQMVNAAPREAHDVLMHLIVTPSQDIMQD